MDKRVEMKNNVFWKNDEVSRYFNDSIHGHIEISASLMRIVDTPCFQRLRKLYQLGVTSKVYPMAENSRFPHSLGVCHLAGKQLDHLVQQWKNDGNCEDAFPATNEELFCVEVAALCHDLGHGPFSHLWDHSIVPSLLKSKSIGPQSNSYFTPKHEHISIYLFKELLWPRVKGRITGKRRLFCTKDPLLNNDCYCDLICQLIAGSEEDYPPELTWQNPPKEKWWLYQIVANKRFEIDVDKFDYILRDTKSLGMGCTVNVERLILKARIRMVEESYQFVSENVAKTIGEHPRIGIPSGSYVIAYKQEEGAELYELFHMRSMLHRRVYQHKTAVSCDLMLRDVLMKSGRFICIKGVSLVDIVKDVRSNLEKYLMLTDNILDLIDYLDPDDHKYRKEEREDILQAQFLLRRYNYRALYKYVACCYFGDKDEIPDEETLLHQFAKDMNVESMKLALKKSEISYCCGNKNPLSYAFFYDDKQLDKRSCFPTPPEEILQLQIPKKFNECFVRLYYTDFESLHSAETTEVIDEIASKFEEWTSRNKGVKVIISPKRRKKNILKRKHKEFDFSSQASG